jgi:hypothetical protein
LASPRRLRLGHHFLLCCPCQRWLFRFHRLLAFLALKDCRCGHGSVVPKLMQHGRYVALACCHVFQRMSSSTEVQFSNDESDDVCSRIFYHGSKFREFPICHQPCDFPYIAWRHKDGFPQLALYEITLELERKFVTAYSSFVHSYSVGPATKATVVPPSRPLEHFLTLSATPAISGDMFVPFVP